MARELEALISRRTFVSSVSGAAALIAGSRQVHGAPDHYAGWRLVHGRVVDQSTGAGLVGVLVSNGEDLTRTDARGRWWLKARPGEHVFIIKPPHWDYVTASGIPDFFHLVSMQQSGDVSEIVFALRPRVEPDDFEVLLIADTQAATAAELQFVRHDLLAHTGQTSARFAISHGDVMGDDLSLLPDYTRLLGETGLTWHHCPGNHDLDLAQADPERTFDPWKQHIGPTHSAFQCGRATFILLNTVDVLPGGGRTGDGRRYRGHISARQLTFVRNVLEAVPRDHLVVCSMHIPLVSFDAPDSPSDTTGNRRALLELLASRPNTVSFSGHSHTTEHHYLGAAEGFLGARPHHHHVLTAFCGSWWGGPMDERGIPIADSRDGSPRGYHVLSVRGTTYATRFVPLPECADPCVRVLQPAPQGAPVAVGTFGVAAAGRDVLVDVFDGGPRTKVVCEIAGAHGARFELSRAAMEDPYIVDMFERHRARMKPWVRAAISSHLWIGPIPEGLAPGEHACTIHITTEYGYAIARAHTLSVPA